MGGDGDGSDSDFGDWEQDNWATTNDNVASAKKKEVTKTPRFGSGV